MPLSSSVHLHCLQVLRSSLLECPAPLERDRQVEAHFGVFRIKLRRLLPFDDSSGP